MLPQDQIKLISCMLISIPLSYMLSTITNSKRLLVVSCISSVLIHLYLLEEGALALWFQQQVVYALCRWGPRKWIGRIVFLESFAYLTIIQARRMYFSYGVQKYDITAILMMQVFLYVGFAFNYQDGMSENPSRKTERTIQQLPSYKEYLGYVLFLPASMVGPVFEFQDYKHYLYRTGIYKDIKPKFTIPAILKEAKTFAFCLPLFISLMAFPFDYLVSHEFRQLNFFYQFLYICLSMLSIRFKYYTAWSLGMISMNASGITYNPQFDKTGEIVENNWNRVVVSDIWAFQMDPSMKKKTDGWNMSVQLALKRYVYDRFYQPSDEHTPKQKKKLQIKAQQTTLAVSALWHGIYPGYYVSFFHWALILQVSQQIFRISRTNEKFSEWKKKLYYVELIFFNFMISYFGVSFNLMSLEKILVFFSYTKFIPIFIAYITNALIVRMAIFSNKKSAKNKKKE